MNNTAALIFITVAIVSLIDYIPRAFLLFKKSTKVRTGHGKVPNYLLMPTVYGDISYLQNLPFLKKYASHVLICTSKYESAEFYASLRKVCRENGLRFIKADVPVVNGKVVKNAYTIYKGAFKNLSRLKVNKNTPCILLDADTYAEKNVNNLIRTFISSKYDVASLRCEVRNPSSLIEVLQAFEYKMAMDNRSMDPWLTSGACNVGKAATFKHVFSRHSDFFAGGDIEIGKLATVMNYSVGHIEFTFYTAVPDSWKAWFDQRIIWFAGGVRHHIINIGSFGWNHFFMLFYNSLIIYLLFPLRWVELINFPATLILLIALSWLYTALTSYKKGWRVAYLALPLYSFIQSMIILPIAFVRYCKYAWQQKSFGFLNYDFTGVALQLRMTYAVLNLSSAAIVLYAAVIFTQTRLQYWEANGWVAHLIASLKL